MCIHPHKAVSIRRSLCRQLNMSNFPAAPPLFVPCYQRSATIVIPLQPVHSLIATLQGDENPQTDSPLFSAVPSELRNAIFRFMLTSYDDKAAPYPEGNHYNRPGYRFRQRIDTALLSTCRRIYREAHILPVSLNEHVFWAGRGPPGVKCSADPVGQFSRLTVEQREAIDSVHLFTQMYWLEGTFPPLCNSDRFRMKNLKVTIRHGDWWNWESNQPLVMKNNWTGNLKAITNLESFEMELETLERDKSQLEAIVKLMQSWRIKLGNGRVLTTEGKKVVPSRYSGPTNYEGLRYDVQKSRWLWDSRRRRQDTTAPTAPAPPLYYVGYTLLWTAKHVPFEH
ncbi:hypothetical protein D9619_006954 [Psilocybe cf. subviscida]|uniref:Uncharacterized protein n=1 Tax=Psilocybe cf. subviscida TaxID=2480587 RepID=A0A8H5B218_9AGAR|nr:hypothetical protein D9619_006954 [Psilocybe cf. subviscida]